MLYNLRRELFITCKGCLWSRTVLGSGNTMIRIALSTLTTKAFRHFLLLKWSIIGLSGIKHPIMKNEELQSGSTFKLFDQSHLTSTRQLSASAQCPLTGVAPCPTCTHVPMYTPLHPPIMDDRAPAIVQFVASSAFSSPHSKEKTSSRQFTTPTACISHHRTTSYLLQLATVDNCC